MAKKQKKLINRIFEEIKVGNFIVTNNKFSDGSGRWIDIDVKIPDGNNCYNEYTITLSFDEKGNDIETARVSCNGEYVDNI